MIKSDRMQFEVLPADFPQVFPILLLACAISMTATKFSCLPRWIFAYPKTEKKTGLVFPAPSQGNYNSKAAELEKVIEILISDSRYADVGLHDRPESSCHLSCNLRGPVVKLVAQRAFSRCLR